MFPGSPKPLVKLRLSLFLVAIMATSAAAAPLPGHTLVSDATLQHDVTTYIMAIEQVLAARCKKPRIVDTRITRPPKTLAEERGTGLAHAKWTERWTIDRCGKKIPYTIDFDMRGSAGTVFNIKGPRK